MAHIHTTLLGPLCLQTCPFLPFQILISLSRHSSLSPEPLLHTHLMTFTAKVPFVAMSNLKYLKHFISSEFSPFNFLPELTCLSHMINLVTLLLFIFPLNFLLWHTLPNSETDFCNFSIKSATSAMSSTNNKWPTSQDLHPYQIGDLPHSPKPSHLFPSPLHP